jgi:hypothetical protein
MITKLDKNTNENMMIKYRKLFDAAFEDLLNAKDQDGNNLNLLSDEEKEKGNFSDLSEYFAHSGDFLTIGKAQYLLLPLDENHLTIDANSRKINVPTEFKNCSGVITDNLAETITFTIDRYFDFVDLSAFNIDVQWVAPGEKGTKRYGVDEIPTQLIDLDTFNPEGKIRFGWPLSADLTRVSGPIEFSVRFYHMDKNTGVVSYVFNTLPETILIQNGLDIPKNSESVTVIANHLDLFNKFITNYNAPAAGGPTPVSFNIKNLEEEYQIDPDVAKDDLTLWVSAHTADFNTLTYQWFKAIDPEQNDGKTRKEIDPTADEYANGPFKIQINYEKVDLTEAQKLNRDFKKYFYEVAPDTYAEYGMNKVWPPVDDEGNPINVYY